MSWWPTNDERDYIGSLRYVGEEKERKRHRYLIKLKISQNNIYTYRLEVASYDISNMCDKSMLWIIFHVKSYCNHFLYFISPRSPCPRARFREIVSTWRFRDNWYYLPCVKFEKFTASQKNRMENEMDITDNNDFFINENK